MQPCSGGLSGHFQKALWLSRTARETFQNPLGPVSGLGSSRTFSTGWTLLLTPSTRADAPMQGESQAGWHVKAWQGQTLCAGWCL